METRLISEGAGCLEIILASRRANYLQLWSKWGGIEFSIHCQCPFALTAHACMLRGLIWGPKEARETPQCSP